MASLIAAVFWFVVGAGLLIWQALHPGNPFLVIRGTQISFGWLALAFAVYNLFRWWSNRPADRQHGNLEEKSRPRASIRQAPPEKPANPDLDFSDKPPEAS
jgi:hypothetical protein